jgi:hypothetical protein
MQRRAYSSFERRFAPSFAPCSNFATRHRSNGGNVCQPANNSTGAGQDPVPFLDSHQWIANQSRELKSLLGPGNLAWWMGAILTAMEGGLL